MNFVNRSVLPALPFATSDRRLTCDGPPDCFDQYGLGGPIVGPYNGVLIVAGGTNCTNGQPWPLDGRPTGAKVGRARMFFVESTDAAWKVNRPPQPLAPLR